jgi:osmotically-inducible protein OsmY
MTLPDAAIRRKLFDELKEQPWTHMYNLSVTVTGGGVDLWGYAQSDDERRAIRVAAEAVPGVTLVNDHLADSPVFAY